MVMRLLLIGAAAVLTAISVMAQTSPPRTFVGSLHPLWLTDDRGETLKLILDTDGARRELHLAAAAQEGLGDPIALRGRGARLSGWLRDDGGIDVVSMALEPAAVSAQLGAGAAAALSGSYPFLTLLCQFGGTTAPHPRSYFDRYFAGVYPGIDHYWTEQSGGLIDFAGSRIVGWIPLPDTITGYQASLDSSMRIARDCMEGADAQVNFPDFFAVNILVSAPFNNWSFASSISVTRDGVRKLYGLTYLQTGPAGCWPSYPACTSSSTYEIQSVFAHEVGHVLGLSHSSGDYGDPYDSDWDVMSGNTRKRLIDKYFDADYGFIAMGTIAFHKDRLGWIPSGRKYTAGRNTRRTLRLERLAQPTGSDFMMVQIPIGGSATRFYTVEARQFAGYDVRLPEEAVILHRVDTGRFQTYVVDPDLNGNPNDAAAQWVPGETYSDAANGIQVEVLERTATGYVVRVTQQSASFSVQSVSAATLRATGGDSLKISGSGFAPGAAASIGGTAAASVVFVDSSTLTVVTPPHLAGSVDISVTQAGTTFTLVDAATVVGTAPTMAVDRTSLVFGSVSGGTASAAKTSAQQVRLVQSGPGSIAWSATPSQPWIVVSPSSGTGSVTLTVGTQFAAGLGGAANGTIQITLSGAANSIAPIAVRLNVLSASTGPVGSFDTPRDDGQELSGSVAVTGWALDDIEVAELQIWRDPHPGDPAGAVFSGSAPQGGKVFVGHAAFVDGARPEVQTANATTPLNARAGWGYLMLTRGVIWDGQGPFRLYAIAIDREGHVVQLGAKPVTINNAPATKPFGAIDSPGPGEVVSGVYANTGWVLTPSAGATISPLGVQVTVDGVFLPGVPSTSDRADITAAFGSFVTAGAGRGLFVDTTTLTNGVHAIAWSVTDSKGNADGVGSRYFTVSNGSLVSAAAVVPESSTIRSLQRVPAEARVTGRLGFDQRATFDNVRAGSEERLTLDAGELDRIEVRLDEGTTDTYIGYLRVGDALTSLPIGSHLAGSTFTWQVGPAFLGAYDLVFVRRRDGMPLARQELRINIRPQGTVGKDR